MAFDYSVGTVWQQLHAPDAAPSTAPASPPAAAPTVAPAEPSVAARPGNRSTPPARGLRGGLTGLAGVAAVLVLACALGVVVRHPEWLRSTPPGDSTAHSSPPVTPAPAPPPMQPPSSTQAAAAPPAVRGSGAEAPAAPPADVAAATAVPAAATPPAATVGPPRPDLSGTWRGDYVDASGKLRLRVVNLSISRVLDDGGIEGTLQYEAASGDGECKLRPRGSSYSFGQQRLQLSPEGCSPHYPRELGVPLDFAGVNPRANTLEHGRIEAPTGEVIRVRLMRVSGI